MKPSIGRMVHYMSRGSADGYFPPVCRAAVITQVISDDDVDHDVVSLCVLNPAGFFFDIGIIHDEEKHPGTWHWPERVE